jgi:hypothetical protein
MRAPSAATTATRCTGHRFSATRRWCACCWRADPAIGVRDASCNATPLGWCLYGSVSGEKKDSGDFVTVVRLLVDAGEVVDPGMLPTGRDDVDQVLRAHLARV